MLVWVDPLQFAFFEHEMIKNFYSIEPYNR